jgi:hypothetical protein
MTVTIGRRDLLVALGGAAVAWPLAASGQDTGKVARIGAPMLPPAPGRFSITNGWPSVRLMC